MELGQSRNRASEAADGFDVEGERKSGANRRMDVPFCRIGKPEVEGRRKGDQVLYSD